MPLAWAACLLSAVALLGGCRFEEGGAWLRQFQPDWAEGNGFACHLWWHKALFRLEALDAAGVLRLIDSHLSGDALQITLQRVDAAAMLWRLHLLGHDMTAASAAFCFSATLQSLSTTTLRPAVVSASTSARTCWLSSRPKCRE